MCAAETVAGGPADAGTAARDAGTDPLFVDAGGDPVDAGPNEVDSGVTVDEPADAGTTTTGDQTFEWKVYTMNLRTAVLERDTAEERTQMVADVIVAEQPDIVCVQEAVEMPNLENRATALAALTGYDVAWSRTFGIDGVFDEGIALLSRHPITTVDVIELPHPDLGGQNQRKAIAAVVDAPAPAPADGMRAFCSHFTTDPIESFKADQSLALLAFMAEHVDDGAPTSFAGDLNATPDELAMQVLAGARDHDGVRGALVDAWAAVRDDSDDGATHPSDDPDRRIDYVWIAGAVAEIVECHHVLDVPDDDGVWASDHIGLICTASFTAP